MSHRPFLGSTRSREPHAHRPESVASAVLNGIGFVLTVLALIGIVLLVSVDGIH